jgi:hypothetical protein
LAARAARVFFVYPSFFKPMKKSWPKINENGLNNRPRHSGQISNVLYASLRRLFVKIGAGGGHKPQRPLTNFAKFDKISPNQKKKHAKSENQSESAGMLFCT